MNKLKIKKVGDRLKYLRLKRGVTQEKLAEQAGVTINYISRIENGTRTPSMELLKKFGEILHFNIALEDVTESN